MREISCCQLGVYIPFWEFSEILGKKKKMFLKLIFLLIFFDREMNTKVEENRSFSCGSFLKFLEKKKNVLKTYFSCWFSFTGKGTQKWKKTGAIYDGDWKCGKRNGFGTLSYPSSEGGFKRVYSGGWKNDKKHVRIKNSIVFPHVAFLKGLYTLNIDSENYRPYKITLESDAIFWETF